VAADSAHVSITNVSPVISNLIFYLNDQSMALPDSPLSYGNTTFADDIKFTNGIDPGTIELPYFNILNGYQTMRFASDSPNAYFVLSNNFKPGGYYSIFVTDTITHGQAQVIVIQDEFNNISDTTKAMVRFLNLSPDAPPMDVWEFPNGGTAGNKIISNSGYLPGDLNSYQNASAFVTVDAGIEYFTANATGTSNVLLQGWLELPSRCAVTIFTKGFLNGNGNNAIDVGAIVYKP
jgi:hypothetical protein